MQHSCFKVTFHIFQLNDLLCFTCDYECTMMLVRMICNTNCMRKIGVLQHARQQLPEVEPSTTSVAEDGQATTTENNYGNTNLREDQSEGRAWRSGQGGCINVAFRKGMTPADANHIETVTRRNFSSKACPSSRR
jgi:hypothetical protein